MDQKYVNVYECLHVLNSCNYKEMQLQSTRNIKKRKYQVEKTSLLHLFPSIWKPKWHVTTFNKTFVKQRQYRNIMKGNKPPNLHANSLNAAEK